MTSCISNPGLFAGKMTFVAGAISSVAGRIPASRRITAALRPIVVVLEIAVKVDVWRGTSFDPFTSDLRPTCPRELDISTRRKGLFQGNHLLPTVQYSYMSRMRRFPYLYFAKRLRRPELRRRLTCAAGCRDLRKVDAVALRTGKHGGHLRLSGKVCTFALAI
ncbi:hypothetical protein MRX96_009692 [Rhipicephalus microplus]